MHKDSFIIYNKQIIEHLQVIRIGDLIKRFKEHNYELFLVGGFIRDIILNCNKDIVDFDFTTNAEPQNIRYLIENWADNVWLTGVKFGTISCIKNNIKIEITTYRRETYNINSRKPIIQYGTSIYNDLSRRDFTINSITFDLINLQLYDPLNGIRDCNNRLLRSAAPKAIQSFEEDPLRIMRLARFIASFDNFNIEINTKHAAYRSAERINIVSKERIRDELVKILCAKYPDKGIHTMVELNIAKYIIPEIASLVALEYNSKYKHKNIYKHTLQVLKNTIKFEKEPQIIVKLAALFHDIGKPSTRKLHADGTVSFYMHDILGAKMTYKRLQILKFPNDIIKDTCHLVRSHLRLFGYEENLWNDSAVRRYIYDHDHLLNEMGILIKSDCTTSNIKKYNYFIRLYDKFEKRIKQIKQNEQIEAIRPELNGNEIIEILNIKPSPMVGKAYKYLLELRLSNGLLGKDIVKDKLLKWWEEFDNNNVN